MIRTYAVGVAGDWDAPDVLGAFAALPGIKEKIDEQAGRSIQIGELQITARLAAAVPPNFVGVMIQHHRTGIGLSDDEVALREEATLTKSGRSITTWPIPAVIGDNGEGVARFWNRRFVGLPMCFITLIGEKPVTVACLQDEAPKVGVPGPGKPGVGRLKDRAREVLEDLESAGVNVLEDLPPWVANENGESP